MKKIKLKIHEVYTLQSELLGNMNRQTGEIINKGLLNEKLKISIKYYLDKLSENLATEITRIEKLKEGLIKEKGQEDEQNGFFVPMRINETFNEQGELVNFDVNPVYIEVQEEISKFMMSECEVEYTPFTLEDLSIETEINPAILFKLVEEPVLNS